MPRGRTEIPSTLERSDKHAREIYAKAHDSAVESYGEGEHAHRVAFAAVKHEYRKVGDHWSKRRGDAGKSRDELYQEARELNVKGRSSMSKEQLGEAVRGARGKK